MKIFEHFLDKKVNTLNKISMSAVKLLLMTFICISFYAAASNAASDKSLTLFSQGKATWLWLDVYQAKLFTSHKVANATDYKTLPKVLLADKEPISLELCYQQDISAEQIVEAAMEGLPKKLSPEKQAEVTRLHESYQSVKPGDCYALEHNREGLTTLKFNGKTVFQSSLAGFKKIYYGIWLGELALSDSLKESLLQRNS